MNKRLHKSLFIGVAALGLFVAAGFSNVQTVSAKSKAAKVTRDYAASAKGSDRNVVPTGQYAIYTKPGTVKGARLVASKTTLSDLANSENSKDYFRAYRIAKTNRGSYYAKVVSFDYQHRGWIYVGKSNPDSDWASVGYGLKHAETTKQTPLPDTRTVQLTNPGVVNGLWNAPYRSQYRAKKLIEDTTPYGGQNFTVTGSVEMTREGTPYYYIVNDNDPQVKGWIYAGAVIEQVPTPTVDNDKVVYAKIIDADSGLVVADQKLTNTRTDLTSAPAFVATELGNGSSDEAKLGAYAPGYIYDTLSAADKSANYSAIAGATYGSTVTVKARLASNSVPFDTLKDANLTTN
ncbi:GW dipeptide domain-containing protein [Lentilactobacillus raoultii]|uniref:GW dipeptide domain-containing protein n=1 Tax=Lentilactobacillus raoultii TaxID=1987503 RepID=A0ABW3PK12_9LACO|nr:GW dipeptide domain-containing protein [Lentilactobacillus raoultii]